MNEAGQAIGWERDWGKVLRASLWVYNGMTTHQSQPNTASSRLLDLENTQEKWDILHKTFRFLKLKLIKENIKNYSASRKRSYIWSASHQFAIRGLWGAFQAWCVPILQPGAAGPERVLNKSLPNSRCVCGRSPSSTRTKDLWRNNVITAFGNWLVLERELSPSVELFGFAAFRSPYISSPLPPSFHEAWKPRVGA